MKLYIAGPISGDPEYKAKFDSAEWYLEACKGHTVLNPTVLPSDLAYEDYFPICFAMIDVADGIVMLDGWTNSNGAQEELKRVLEIRQKGMKKEIFFGIEQVPFEKVEDGERAETGETGEMEKPKDPPQEQEKPKDPPEELKSLIEIEHSLEYEMFRDKLGAKPKVTLVEVPEGKELPEGITWKTSAN